VTIKIEGGFMQHAALPLVFSASAFIFGDMIFGGIFCVR
jgi:hypothetical protein